MPLGRDCARGNGHERRKKPFPLVLKPQFAWELGDHRAGATWTWQTSWIANGRGREIGVSGKGSNVGLRRFVWARSIAKPNVLTSTCLNTPL